MSKPKENESEITPEKQTRDGLSVLVALILAFVVFVRPWRDGITFAGFNHYFLIALILATALWGARMLVRAEPLRQTKLVFLMLAFLCVAALLSRSTIQMDNTYRALLYWTAYAFVFILITNGVRTERSLYFILVPFAFSALLNASWSIIHLDYVIPYMRQLVDNDPSVLRMFAAVNDAEFQNRLYANRAMGTHLHANSLAGFLILVIPFALAELRPAFLRCRELYSAPAPAVSGKKRMDHLRKSAAVGLVAWFVTSACAFFLYPYLLLTIKDDQNWTGHPVYVGIFLVALPLLMGAIGVYATRKYAASLFGLGIYCTLLTAIIPVGLWALWLTKSRGAMLALFFAMCFVTFLYNFPRAKLSGISRLAARFGVALLLIALCALGGDIISSPSFAQIEGTLPPVENSEEFAGRDIEVSDLASGDTFMLRLSYWRIAWEMFKDYPLTGVGLGNFAVPYAFYLYEGAAFTRMAHNVLLKLAAETGLLGVLLFAAFWGYSFIAGALRVLTEQVRTRRWCLAGLYASTLAFFLHSMLDFNFASPSLTTLAYFFCGLFWLRSHFYRDAEEPSPPVQRSRAYAVALLLLVAFATGTSLRVFLGDLAITEGSIYNQFTRIGEPLAMRRRSDVADYFLMKLKEIEIDPERPPYKTMEEVGLLIPDPDRIATFGLIRVPLGVQGGALRPLKQNEIPPLNSIVFIRNAAKAREAAVLMSEAWIKDLEQIDEIYPYNPENSLLLHEWYDMLFLGETDTERRRAYLLKSESWIKKTVDRSPKHSPYRAYYGRTLLLRGTIEVGMESAEFYNRGLAQYDRATELYPRSYDAWNECALAHTKVAKAFSEAGMEDEAKGMRTRAAFARKKAIEFGSPIIEETQ